MTPPIDHITIEREILVRPDLSLAEKMLFALIEKFSKKGRGLTESNEELAIVLGIRADSVSKILSGLKGKIPITIINPQTRHRRIYFGDNPKVEHRGKSQSKDGFTLEKNPPTLDFNPPTSEKTPNITKEHKRTEERDSAPEQKAIESFMAAKVESTLPPEFLNWFEFEVLGRWNKYSVSKADLNDWNCLYDNYGGDILTAAIQRHKGESTRWEPTLSAAKKLAGKIRTEQRKQQQPQQTQRQEPIEPTTAFWVGDAARVTELYRKGNAFERRLIAKHRPEIVKGVAI